MSGHWKLSAKANLNQECVRSTTKHVRKWGELSLCGKRKALVWTAKEEALKDDPTICKVCAKIYKDVKKIAESLGV